MGARQQGQLVSSGGDRHVEVRQVRGKRAAIGAALVDARACARRILLVLDGLVAGENLLDILERQKQLLGIKLLRATAELRALQLAQQMPQAVHLRQRLVALGDRSVASCDRTVALRARRRKQRLQRADVRRKLICDLVHVQQ